MQAPGNRVSLTAKSMVVLASRNRDMILAQSISLSLSCTRTARWLMRCSEIAPSRVACIRGRLSPCLGSTLGTTISMLGIPKPLRFKAEDHQMIGPKMPPLRLTDPGTSGIVPPSRAPIRKSWRATSPSGI